MDKKKKLKQLDIFVSLIVILFIASLFLTNLYVNLYSKDTGADVNKVFAIMESNPIAKVLILSYDIKMMIMVTFLPALFITLYIIFRKRIDILILEFYVLTLFFMFLLNFFNDLGAVLGVLLR